MDENLRFIEVLDDLKQKGTISDYVQAAKELGTNKAGISDIKSGRKKLSIELLRRMKESYPEVNIEWIVMGIGDMYITKAASNTAENSNIQLFIEKLSQQAEEIGRLREQIEQMRKGRGARCFGCEHSQSCQCRVTRSVGLLP